MPGMHIMPLWRPSLCRPLSAFMPDVRNNVPVAARRPCVDGSMLPASRRRGRHPHEVPEDSPDLAYVMSFVTGIGGVAGEGHTGRCPCSGAL